MGSVSSIGDIIILVYFTIIIIIGLWASLKQKNTSSGYFLAGKPLTWFVIGASLFASNISIAHLLVYDHIGMGHKALFLEHIPHLQSQFKNPIDTKDGHCQVPEAPGMSSVY